MDKTPTSLLKEICEKIRLAPIYEFAFNNHSNLFSCKCHLTYETYETYYEFNVVADDANEKRAKHLASLSVLKMIRDAELGTNAFRSDLIAIDQQTDSTGKLAIECFKLIDPVDELNKIAYRMRAPLPDYIFSCYTLDYHSCFVRFKEIKEIGFGKTKKEAKKDAAEKLLNRIKPPEAAFIEQEQKIKHNNNTFEKDDVRKDAYIQTTNLYQQMRTSSNEGVKRLLAYDVMKDDPEEFNKQLLDLIAHEEKFEYKTYKKTVIDKTFIFFQFQTNPEIMIFGSGSNSDEAFKNAVYSSLLHLKINITLSRD